MSLLVRLAVTQQDKDIANSIVEDHHSYVASSRTVGRCLKYLIYLDERCIGTFWLGSGFKPTPKALLNFFNVSQKQFDEFFNTVADNKRFCMSERIPNIGSQVLRQIRQRAKSDWMERYGDDLKAIVTTIGGGKSGAVYRADNWQKIGETAGLPADRKSVSMKWDDNEGIKQKFVKPTGDNKKIIFITTRLT
jgi:hypothetical protein